MGFFDLHEPEDGQDQFFLYAMIVLPICSSSAYVFDAWFHFQYPTEERSYEGLLSTITIVFLFLQYCVPIRSRKALTIYYIILCMITETGTIGYLIYYIEKKDIVNMIFYSCSILFDLLFTSGLIYCRVIKQYESHILVENKHLFHFMSRLEVILTIFIPAYMNSNYTSLTRKMIAYFLLFDFFSDAYSRFQGVWIKSALYLFATTTTISVATEWFYFNHHNHIYERVSVLSELVAAILCYTIIILQFFPFHFKTQHVQNIAREALLFQRNLYASHVRTSIAITRAIDLMKNEEIKNETETTTTGSKNDLSMDTTM
ncbi:unnamed protein product [Adineta steineri]|uniref:Uncharacterized protein n=1 Tax=Adineta steineri TaxID=433720 RepID=A0A814S675_9BILA|nr:unnamed protein product [Adineta steineri]CAF1136456.1 unnamed protein product [Adineta steineri]CAF1143187.1 unnamed protein product [Adineta steineri]